MNAVKTKRRKNNFIDNKEFYAAMVEYRNKVNEAKENGDPKPRIPRYIGKCFLDIAEHLSMRPNFSNYMYRQDMVMDAVENCVVYCYNFDPEKSKNPSLISHRSVGMPLSGGLVKRNDRLISVIRLFLSLDLKSSLLETSWEPVRTSTLSKMLSIKRDREDK